MVSNSYIMDRLFVFGIGGSGERVMRSLVMLLAGGMPLDCNKVQPVFIDSDQRSRALSRACEAISAYRKARCLHNLTTVSWNVDPLVQRSSLFHVEILEPILLDIDGGVVKNLNTLVNEREMDNYPSVKAEFNQLYTTDSRTMDLTFGFVGNPSIGAVVLNKMLQDAFDSNPNLKPTTRDGCFIVGSIFGGTGAAGFPLLVNKLRDMFKDNIDGLKIGGLTMFPYFDLVEVEDDNSTMGQLLKNYDVDHSQFSTKSKASLSYYDKYVKSLSSLYFLGSGEMSFRSKYPKHKGGEEQDNPAHLLEVIGAKAVSHFTFNAKPLTQELQKDNFKGATTYYNYFVEKIPDVGFNLQTIDEDTEFRAVFVRMQLLHFIWKKCVPSWIAGNLQWSSSIGMNVGKYDAMMGQFLGDYFALYDEWVKELQSNYHSDGFKFKFFDLSSAYDDPDADRRIGSYFNPPISFETKSWGLGRASIVDPKILAKMQDKDNEHKTDKLSTNESIYQFAFYTSLYAIEHIIADSGNKQCINLNYKK